MRKLTARTPADLIAMVPIVLGFHPSESTVMMTFGPRQFHARVDLATTDEDRTGVTHSLVAPCLQHAVERVVFMFFTADYDLARLQFVALRDYMFDNTSIEIVDAIYVHDGHYASVVKHDGQLFPYDADTSPVTTEAIVDGVAPMKSRDDLARQITPGNVVPLADVLTHLRPDDDDLTADTRMVERMVRAGVGGDILDDAELAVLLGCLTNTSLRDVALNVATQPRASEAVEFWGDVVRRAPVEYRIAPLALFAFSAWLSGHGALAWTAVDAAKAIGPDYTLIHLVEQALRQAIDPHTWSPAHI